MMMPGPRNKGNHPGSLMHERQGHAPGLTAMDDRWPYDNLGPGNGPGNPHGVPGGPSNADFGGGGIWGPPGAGLMGPLLAPPPGLFGGPHGPPGPPQGPLGGTGQGDPRGQGGFDPEGAVGPFGGGPPGGPQGGRWPQQMHNMPHGLQRGFGGKGDRGGSAHMPPRRPQGNNMQMPTPEQLQYLQQQHAAAGNYAGMSGASLDQLQYLAMSL